MNLNENKKEDHEKRQKSLKEIKSFLYKLSNTPRIDKIDKTNFNQKLK